MIYLTIIFLAGVFTGAVLGTASKIINHFDLDREAV